MNSFGYQFLPPTNLGRVDEEMVAPDAQPVEWLATLTAVPLGLGSNPGEDMDVCKCIVPLRHSAFADWLVEGVERWEALDHPRCPPSKLGWKQAKSNCHLYGAQSYG
ncbi:hypothetical protein TNCV_4352611 [Trichonephila clavipes]|nr:hypothetical protein TNCV_4352611 [Trichonephila clavipes]